MNRRAAFGCFVPPGPLVAHVVQPALWQRGQNDVVGPINPGIRVLVIGFEHRRQDWLSRPVTQRLSGKGSVTFVGWVQPTAFCREVVGCTHLR
jgi:hypothetical protein